MEFAGLNYIALQMLVGDRAKFYGIVLGLSFAALLMTQQMAIFCGLMDRSASQVGDLGHADIWVMDKSARYVDDVIPMQDTALYRVRSIDGVEWAVAMFKSLTRTRLKDGSYQNVFAVGLDDTSLVGYPFRMIEGRVEDLHRVDAVIVDVNGLSQMKGLQVGDDFEMNNYRAHVVGISNMSRTFENMPIVYTTLTRVKRYAPGETKFTTYCLVKARPGQDIQELCDRINKETGLVATTNYQMRWKTIHWWMVNTGIPVNFGITVLLGFIIGSAIAGQTFFNFTLENLRHFGTLRAMGAANHSIVRMILLQAALSGFIGYGIGVGMAALFGKVFGGGELAWLMPWEVLALTAGGVFLIMAGAAGICIRKAIRHEPAMVFRN